MNGILVAVEPWHSSVSAAVYAVNLAQRINSRVTFLMMTEPMQDANTFSASEEALQKIKVRLQNVVKQSSSEVRVNYYISNGPYENELISFIRENRINLLVVNSPPPENNKKQEGIDSFLDRMMSVKRETRCRIILVSERSNSRTVKGSITL